MPLLHCPLQSPSLFPSHSGGRIITLEGRGFGLVQNVSMAVRGIGREHTVGVLAGDGAGLRACCQHLNLGPWPVPQEGLGALVGLGSDALPLLLPAL